MKKGLYLGCGLAVIAALWAVLACYPDWLWFNNLGYASVFWPMKLGKIGLGAAIWIAFMVIVFINFVISRRITPVGEEGGTPEGRGSNPLQRPISTKTLNALIAVLILVAAFVVSAKGSAQWPLFLSYLNQVPFEGVDPIFGKGLGFYVFSLPVFMIIQNGLLLMFFFAVVLTVILYMKDGSVQILEEVSQDRAPLEIPKIKMIPQARKHIFFLLGILLLIVSWGYYLKVYGILYSTQGPAFGASYVDISVRIPVYKILAILSIALGVLLILETFKSRGKFVWKAGAVWLGAVLVLSMALPVLVQKFVVKPNELAKEGPYIVHNIAFTRKAYGLDKIQEVDFLAREKLGRQDIENHEGTFLNIRVWDERPLLQTYRQIQSIRLYYDFDNVDVDRYTIEGRYRQLMLAAREMQTDQLPAQANTWVNRHLIYTHGYGLAASPVNDVTKEGLPRLFIKNLPPETTVGMDILRPEIYFGEKTNDYVLLKTTAREFDYPKGDKNVYTIYQGEGGVPLGTFWRRLLYAFEFGDPQILFTNYLKPDSRILYNRRLDRRVRVLAPFLDYDRDPYLTLISGRLVWVIDAYTTSSMYPYSLRSSSHFAKKGVNYIRNSVKVFIDAYDGNVDFYQVDEKDPILRTFSKIFPDLFKSMDEMPEEMKRHLRYPRDLFELQAKTYGVYHMTDTQVFYNQEDLWQVPDEIYGDRRQAMMPYYIISKLPGQDQEEFLLMLPFTPSKKDNMIGWLAARNDGASYGTLLVYKLPKEKLVYGPMQIEARVDQQTEISRELSLWDQRGSRVIRGNMLAIPISDTFLYIEPVYLEAKQEQVGENSPGGASGQKPGQFSGRSKAGAALRRPEKARTAALPELKRVIAALGNRMVMEENLEKAIARILEEPIRLEEAAAASLTGPPGEETGIQEMGRQALTHYNRAKAYLQAGDWAGYGRELEQLEGILENLSRTEVQEN